MRKNLATIFLFLFVLLSPGRVLAQNGYELPYPGILPTHPLYFLKPIRDNLALLITFKPEGKVALLISLSDKRLAAARDLALLDKSSEAETQLVKSEEFFDQAMDGYNKLAIKDKELTVKFIAAIRGRQETLPAVLAKIAQERRPGFEKALLAREKVKRELILQMWQIPENE